jgi:hypothetical protein
LKPAQNKMKIDHEAQNAKVMDADGKHVCYILRIDLSNNNSAKEMKHPRSSAYEGLCLHHINHLTHPLLTLNIRKHHTSTNTNSSGLRCESA